MKVYELLQQVAEMMVDVHIGTTTAEGGTTYLIDTSLRFPSDHFNDGILWITSGTYVGAYRVKANNTQGRITIDTTLAGAVPASVTYAIAEGIYPLERMKQAMNWVLDDSQYMVLDTSLTTTDDTESYALPSGVTRDVRRVEIATETDAPYKWFKHKAWDIIDDDLVFLDHLPEGGYTIRLHYVGYQDTISSLTADIPITVDTRHLKYKIIAWLYRQYFRQTKKDHPEQTDLLTEAAENASIAAERAGEPYLLPRDAKVISIRNG